MKPSHVSRLTTNRLSVYLRCLNTLEQAGIKTVSSRELAEQFHLNSAQIRKDLANFGEFGVRGVGYDVPLLTQQLIRILGLNKPYNIIIAGAGNLGLALAAQQRYDDAIAAYKEAIRLDPRFTWAHFNLSTSYWMTGHLADTVRELEETLRLDPKNAEALKWLPLAKAKLQGG